MRRERRPLDDDDDDRYDNIMAKVFLVLMLLSAVALVDLFTRILPSMEKTSEVSATCCNIGATARRP